MKLENAAIALLLIFLATIETVADSKSQETFKVWVTFTDKDLSSANKPTLSKKALERRNRVGLSKSVMYEDLSINEKYIAQVEKLGGKKAVVFTWGNSVSFYVSSRAQIHEIIRLPFVNSVIPVAKYKQEIPSNKKGLQKRSFEASDQLKHVEMVSVHLAQYYLKKYKNKIPGQDVRIGFFDSGFWLEHPAFNYVKEHGQIYKTYDFVDKDSTVFDPDSVQDSLSHPYHTNESHGTGTFGLVGAYDTANYMGIAYGANFILARTEDAKFPNTNNSKEVHAEEDNWVSAIVWAENAGVDIVSSSLGYRDGFEDTAYIKRDTGIVAIKDYSYENMDGNTAIVSVAARAAAKRGVVIVNSMGNEGSKFTGTLTAPADVEEVISVGAISYDSALTYFSSTGPTATGKIKPDLVAPGDDVEILDLNYDFIDEPAYYYTTSDGTSFSAPIVTGICGLIATSFPGISSDALKAKLYNSCSFLPEQKGRDNFYGRGLPDALLACLQSNEVFLNLSLENQPEEGVSVLDEYGKKLAVSDSMGTALIMIDPKNLPYTIQMTHQNGVTKTYTITETPVRLDIDFSIKNVVNVVLKDEQDSVIRQGYVFSKKPGDKNFMRSSIGSYGMAAIEYYSTYKLEIFAYSPGYEKSNILSVNLQGTTCTLTIQLKKIIPEQLQIFPTVLHKGKNDTLKIQFVAKQDRPLYYNQKVKVQIRAIDGQLVYLKEMIANSSMPVNITWNCRNMKKQYVVPGTYICLVEYAGKVQKKKILIVG